MRKIGIILFFTVLNISTFALNVDRVEPTFWWVGMKNPTVQLMVHGQKIAATEITLSYPGVKIKTISR